VTLQSTGPISLDDVAAEFGGTVPHGVDEYADKVGKTATAGQNISFSEFYGLNNWNGFTTDTLTTIMFDDTTGWLSYALDAGTKFTYIKSSTHVTTHARTSTTTNFGTGADIIMSSSSAVAVSDDGLHLALVAGWPDAVVNYYDSPSATSTTWTWRSSVNLTSRPAVAKWNEDATALIIIHESAGSIGYVQSILRSGTTISLGTLLLSSSYIYPLSTSISRDLRTITLRLNTGNTRTYEVTGATYNGFVTRDDTPTITYNSSRMILSPNGLKAIYTNRSDSLQPVIVYSRPNISSAWSAGTSNDITDSPYYYFGYDGAYVHHAANNYWNADSSIVSVVLRRSEDIGYVASFSCVGEVLTRISNTPETFSSYSVEVVGQISAGYGGHGLFFFGDPFDGLNIAYIS